MSNKKTKAAALPERIRYAADNKSYACIDPNCKAHHDAEYVRADLLLTTIRKDEREVAFKEAADHIRRQWLAAYPVEVFPEPPEPPAECSRDRISAAMGRHMATKLIEHFEAAAASAKGDNDG